MRSNCYFCHLKTLEKLLRKFRPEEEIAQQCIFQIHELMGSQKNLSNPELVTLLHRKIRTILQKEDLYREEKENANSLLLKMEDYWRERIHESPSPFATAARLAVVGNIIDYGAHAVAENLRLQIEELANRPLAINHTDLLEKEVNKAHSILYLGDNAGEIVFDKLFIETMHHPHLTFAVRGHAVINDATRNEAEEVGLTQICQVIDNGYDAPSTLLPYCSPTFRSFYDRADLIIAKGQGNLEGLLQTGHQNTFFLLIAKCSPMAKLLGVKKGEMVIKKLF